MDLARHVTSNMLKDGKDIFGQPATLCEKLKGTIPEDSIDNYSYLFCSPAFVHSCSSVHRPGHRPSGRKSGSLCSFLLLPETNVLLGSLSPRKSTTLGWRSLVMGTVLAFCLSFSMLVALLSCKDIRMNAVIRWLYLGV